jgi:thiosulfate reductase cytochrome b subunit
MSARATTAAKKPPLLPSRVLRWQSPKTGRERAAAYEHPFIVRFCHWLNTVSLFILAGSGLQIFMAFPSFGPKIPQKNFVLIPGALRIGGWLGGALQWHLTFAWIYLATGLIYVGYQFASGNYRQTLFTLRDAGGVWPMARYYFFRGPKPDAAEPYNPLQKLAYTSVILIAVLSVWTGFVLYKPVQLSFLAWPLGGFHLARVWHFSVLCLLTAFVLGHLVMVILHGWKNFVSIFTGWKRDPEYLEQPGRPD